VKMESVKYFGCMPIGNLFCVLYCTTNFDIDAIGIFQYCEL